jgi:putative ABC transport system permease protein
VTVLHRKLLRTLRGQWGQSLAVVAVVLCGIASYIAVYSAYLNLQLTRDTYYRQYRFADFEIQLERAPETAALKLEEIPGVRKVRGRIVRDVSVDVPNVDEARVGRLISMPIPRRPVINDIVLRAGRYFEPGAQNEVILSERFAQENDLQVGDTIGISIEQKKYSLNIIGLGLSPEYVYVIRNVQELIPSPDRFGILWVPEDFAESTLAMQGAHNNLVGLADDPQQLDAIFDQVEKLLKPYGVYAKTRQYDQLSNRFISDEIRNLGVLATITPTLFLAIAALIILVLLNRMVRMERTQIGLMRAYGYSRIAVGIHYITYGLLLAVSGCMGGFVLGQWLARGMILIYVQFYQFPLLESRIYPEILLRSIGITLVFATLGALAAAIQAARIHPAESMRPEAPRSAHNVWLERFPALWRRLGFSRKMIVRNISRNSFRAGLNVFGVAISTGLLIMGFFTIDSMDFAMAFQFEDVQREDVKVNFQLERGRGALHDMARLAHVRRAEPMLEYPFEIRSAWREKDILVVGLEESGELQQVLSFSGERADLSGGGITLTTRLARLLDVRPGDHVLLKPLMGRVEGEHRVPVDQVVEQFIGMSAYMNLHTLSRMLDEPFAMTAALLRIEEGADAEVNRALKDIAGVASVGFRQDAYGSLRETLAMSMNITNFTILIFAGIIAFSIIYNITMVALAERQRELASLRVLGLSETEVGRILYDENMVLSIVGVALGIPLGIAISKWLVKAFDSDLFRLPFHIEGRTYAGAVLLTLFYVLLANLAVRRKIRQLDLVEVLKQRE